MQASIASPRIPENNPSPSREAKVRSGDETVQVLHKLMKLGFTDVEFRRMHHMNTSAASHMKYCTGKNFQEDSRNQILLTKLRRELGSREENN
jgi:hypothetical protein